MASLFLKVILATSLLAHTMLGCCWHHAHGEDCGEAVAVVEPDCHHHASHECEQADAADLAPAVADAHGHWPACDEPDCTFVKDGPAKPVLAQPTSLAVLLAPMSAGGPARHTLNRAAEHHAARLSGAALRAALQVWLV